jgi:hypothetical protein
MSCTAPAELDKTSLTKEERKRIRKEQKREKRQRTSEKYGATKPATASSSSAGSESLTPPVAAVQAESGDHADDDYYEGNHRTADALNVIRICAGWNAGAAVLAENISCKHIVAIFVTRFRDPSHTNTFAALCVGYCTGFDGFEKEDAVRSAATAPMTSTIIGVGIADESAVGADGKVMPVTDVGAVSARRASVSLVKGLMQSLGIHNTVGIEPLEASVPAVSASKAVPGGDSRASEAAQLRLLANEATNKFKIAEVEKELETEKQKQEAAMKLKLRLKLKKGKTDPEGANGEAAVANGTATGRTAEEEEAEMHRIKAEKLRQHKMQENRRNQSMHVAKERSGQALQKRLDELAAKKRVSCNL